MTFDLDDESWLAALRVLLCRRACQLAVLSLLLGFAGIALAEENVWNEETFEYYASIIRQQRDTHSRLIDGCAIGRDGENGQRHQGADRTRLVYVC
ncbi:hypothetical protein ACVJBD_002197 [Rhizobium mongolense]